MAVPDGWPSARFGGCTEPGLQAGSPAAPTSFVRCLVPGRNSVTPTRNLNDHEGHLAAASVRQGTPGLWLEVAADRRGSRRPAG